MIVALVIAIICIVCKLISLIIKIIPLNREIVNKNKVLFHRNEANRYSAEREKILVNQGDLPSSSDYQEALRREIFHYSEYLRYEEEPDYKTRKHLNDLLDLLP
jgi:hypothetical protein